MFGTVPSMGKSSTKVALIPAAVYYKCASETCPESSRVESSDSASFFLGLRLAITCHLHAHEQPASRVLAKRRPKKGSPPHAGRLSWIVTGCSLTLLTGLDCTDPCFQFWATDS